MHTENSAPRATGTKSIAFNKYGHQAPTFIKKRMVYARMTYASVKIEEMM